MTADQDTIDRLNRDLDAACAGSKAPNGTDPALTEAIRHLRALDDAFAPAPTVKEQMWRTVMTNPVTLQTARGANDRSWTNGRIAWPAAPARTPHAHRSRPWWPGAELAAVAVLLVAIVAAYAGPRLWPSESKTNLPAMQAPRPIALYVSDAPGEHVDPGTWGFIPLDPVTLADLDDQPALTFEHLGWFATSGDGSTMVSIDYDDENESVTIVVRDGADGAERARFHPPAPVILPHLSRAGTRLVAMAKPDVQRGDPGPDRWFAFDTRDGRLLTTVVGEQRGSGPLDFWIDPEARRLYHVPLLGAVAERRPTQPQLLQLYAYDLTTGEKIGQLALPGIQAGGWLSDEASAADLAMSVAYPGIALSPDGRRLAIAHTDSDAVTLIDTERFAVERTIALTRPTGLVDTFLGLLPLAPHDAVAKTEEGTTLHAVFGPDGKRLYVFGSKGVIDKNGEPEWRGLGLRVLDLASGQIVAETLDDTWINDVLPAPDGQSIYVIGPTGPYAFGGAGGETIVLRRMDANTLEPLAEREFSGWRTVILRPAA